MVKEGMNNTCIAKLLDGRHRLDPQKYNLKEKKFKEHVDNTLYYLHIINITIIYILIKFN